MSEHAGSASPTAADPTLTAAASQASTKVVDARRAAVTLCAVALAFRAPTTHASGHCAESTMNPFRVSEKHCVRTVRCASPQVRPAGEAHGPAVMTGASLSHCREAHGWYLGSFASSKVVQPKCGESVRAVVKAVRGTWNVITLRPALVRTYS